MDPLTWAAVGGLASVAGAWLGGNANKDAANTQAAAIQSGTQAEVDAINRAQAQEQQYGTQAQQLYGDLAEHGAAGPGGDYLRRTVGEQGNLTPLQQQQLAEIQRQQTNQVRTSSIAGSGRTAAALFRDTSNDFINRSLEANRGRAFGAAGTLAGQSYGAGMARAGVPLAMGRDLAGMTANIGRVQGQGIKDVGSTNAQAELATGKLYGSAVGDIGSYIASAGRQSRFRDAGYNNPTYGDTSRADTGYYSYGAGGLNAG